MCPCAVGLEYFFKSLLSLMFFLLPFIRGAVTLDQHTHFYKINETYFKKVI